MLAEYIDGGLEPRDRAQVEAHLAECGECYENFAETVRVTSSIPLGSKASWRDNRFGRIAVAAVLIVGVGSAAITYERRVASARQIAALVTTVTGERMTEARLSASIAWGPRPGNLRGGQDELDRGVRAAATTLVTERKNSLAAGLGALALGNYDAAVSAFDLPATNDAESDRLTNLSAALIERWRRGDRASHADLDRALEAAEKSFQIARLPSSAFNVALALEYLGQREAAVTAWETYLKLQEPGLWQDEGRAHLAALKERNEK